MVQLIAFGISQTWSEPFKDIPSLSLWLSDKYGINVVYLCTPCFLQCQVTLHVGVPTAGRKVGESATKGANKQ